MPELPDVTVYAECIERNFGGTRLNNVRVGSPFVVRTHTPAVHELENNYLLSVRRIGKRLALGFGETSSTATKWCVIHLMIAGRLHQRPVGSRLIHRRGLLSMDFQDKTLELTEAGTKRRASVHVFRSWSEALTLDRGGVDPLLCSFNEFEQVVRRENHTLKRVLCDPALISGIGNAYSDEILFWSELSPVMRSQGLSTAQMERLFVATRHTLRAWTTHLRRQLKDGFPESVTAFRPEMAVHGRYKLPCKQCGTSVARIVYAQNETNYCPRCQTAGKLLADRALSRLLRKDWPKHVEDWEERRSTLQPR